MRPKVSYHRIEILFGEFETQILVPGQFLEDQIQAQYEDGFLVVTLPKSAPYSISVAKSPEE